MKQLLLYFHLVTFQNRTPEATLKTIHITSFTQLSYFLYYRVNFKIIPACLGIVWSKLHFCRLGWNCTSVVAFWRYVLSSDMFI